ncbi:hypothetical protein BBK14_31040 [Parafrankia soli]|uniref:Uncharacterized protein n=1 Tax=Parafrankia soli TaxID=2599596 RepID=A0A1S1RBR1_9ACTN|nr:hypothetical protein BBK14_31040 [Parafrankia soli]
MRSSVDLPEPDAPISATISPAPTRSETSSSTRVPSGNVMPTPSNASVVPGGARPTAGAAAGRVLDLMSTSSTLAVPGCMLTVKPWENPNGTDMPDVGDPR